MALLGGSGLSQFRGQEKTNEFGLELSPSSCQVECFFEKFTAKD